MALVIFAQCSPVSTSKFLGHKDVTYLETDKQNRQICNDQLNYIPDTNFMDYFNMRYVRINIHFMNNSDSTATFDEEKGVEYAKSLVYHANLRLQDNQKMNLPVGNNTPVLPVLYRYVITPDTSVPGDNGIYFHYDDSLCYVNIKDRGPTLFTKAHYNKYSRQKGKVINIFLMEHHPDSLASPTYREITGGVGAGPWAKVLSAYNQSITVGHYKDDGSPVHNGPWSMARPFNHELGHCLGLHHTWSGNDGCDDTPNNANCWNHSDNPPCDGEITNNMMDYNVCACAITPCQIGIVHRNISRPEGPARPFVREDWCHPEKFQDVIIYRGQDIDWPCHKDLHGNLVINNGATLTIHCSIHLPKGAKVTVRPGGKLILDGGSLTNRCGEQWEGIEIWEKKKSRGEVVFINGAKVKNARHEINPGKE